MFCEKCGANNPEGAQSCLSCGAPMEVIGFQQGKKTNGKKIAIIVVAVLVVLGILGNIIPNLIGGGYEKPIKNFAKFMETGDEECFYDAMPQCMVDALTEDEKEMISGMFEAAFKSLDVESVNYEITDKEELDEDDLKDFEENLEESLEDDVDVEVTDGYSCEVTFEMKAEVDGEKKEDSQDMEINVYKVDGEWCLDVFSLM